MKLNIAIYFLFLWRFVFLVLWQSVCLEWVILGNLFDEGWQLNTCSGSYSIIQQDREEFFLGNGGFRHRLMRRTKLCSHRLRNEAIYRIQSWQIWKLPKKQYDYGRNPRRRLRGVTFLHSKRENAVTDSKISWAIFFCFQCNHVYRHNISSIVFNIGFMITINVNVRYSIDSMAHCQ